MVHIACAHLLHPREHRLRVRFCRAPTALRQQRRQANVGGGHGGHDHHGGAMGAADFGARAAPATMVAGACNMPAQAARPQAAQMGRNRGPAVGGGRAPLGSARLWYGGQLKVPLDGELPASLDASSPSPSPSLSSLSLSRAAPSPFLSFPLSSRPTSLGQCVAHSGSSVCPYCPWTCAGCLDLEQAAVSIRAHGHPMAIPWRFRGHPSAAPAPSHCHPSAIRAPSLCHHIASLAAGGGTGQSKPRSMQSARSPRPSVRSTARRVESSRGMPPAAGAASQCDSSPAGLLYDAEM